MLSPKRRVSVSSLGSNRSGRCGVDQAIRDLLVQSKNPHRRSANEKDAIEHFKAVLAGKFESSRSDYQHATSKPLDWTTAIEVPNPERASSKRGVSWKEAEAILRMGFKGRETADDVLASSHVLQEQNAEEERIVFMDLFEALPDSSDGNGKAWGESPPLSSSSRYENAPKSFLSLVRNMIVAKLMLHCSVRTKCLLSEDAERIYIVATCTTHELLREADRQCFPTELDIVAVDPEALEPCTKTFYPLLRFYHANLHEVVCSVTDKIGKICNNLASRTLNERLQVNYLKNALTFWSCVESNRMSNATMSVPTSRIKPHLGSEREQEETCDAFKRYLDLVGAQSARQRKSAIQRINKEQKASRKTKLYNFYDRLKLPIIPPYLNFEVGLYLGVKGKPWVWQHYYTRLLDSDIYLGVPFSGQQIVKLFISAVDRQLNLDRLISANVVVSMFPLDKRDKLELFERATAGMHIPSIEALTGEPSELVRGWSFPQGSTLQQIRHLVRSLFRTPSVDAIRSYYGEDIAFYFAIAKHLSQWSMVPAGFGVLTFMLQQTLRFPLALVVLDVLYSFLIGCWAAIWTESWKRQEAVLVAMWGQQHRSSFNEFPRPGFRGLPRRSPVNFRDDDLFQPSIFSHGHVGWVPRRLLTTLVMVSLTILDLGCMIGVWTARRQLKMVLNHTLAEVIASCFLSALMFVVSWANYPLCKALTEFENHRLSKDYHSQLILKQTAMEMVNNFMLYIYIAFGKGSTEGCAIFDDRATRLEDVVCLEELKLSYMSIFLCLVAMNFVELGILDAMKTWLTKKPKNGTDDAEENMKLHGKATIVHILDSAARKATFDPSVEVSGTYNEYMEIVVLFGHIVLFSVVFPLAPLISMVLLLIEVRIDGHKLFYSHRRPIPKGAMGIGAWKDVFQAISWFAVVTNALLLTYKLDTVMKNDSGEGLNARRALTLVFIIEALVCSKALLMKVIPDESDSVRLLQQHNACVQQSVLIDDLTLLSLDEDSFDTRVHDCRNEAATHDACNYGLIPNTSYLKELRARRSNFRPTPPADAPVDIDEERSITKSDSEMVAPKSKSSLSEGLQLYHM